MSANIPEGDVMDNDYKSRPGESYIPVQSDDKPVEDPIDSATADSDEQLAKDEDEAIDKSNIMEERTRGAKPAGTYREPGDEEGLPGPDDGTSAVAKSGS
ncbi:hypothetical protein GJ744_002093 [Endocarpon pusillum]|uniref:Histone chaperone domain-containing protein n=1 Tax=Endocarpon pusillum TaxID=364733 RepID=A0A8H7E064_9EURO|nr:hypothetical protein GJ744_002093 [Endocarpon pusillum]